MPTNTARRALKAIPTFKKLFLIAPFSDYVFPNIGNTENDEFF